MCQKSHPAFASVSAAPSKFRRHNSHPPKKLIDMSASAVSLHKIIRKNNRSVEAVEQKIATELTNIELAADDDLKNDIKALRFVSAKEFDIGNGHKSTVIFTTKRHFRAFRKIQARLVGELEKKLASNQIIVVCQRPVIHHKSSDDAGAKKTSRKATVKAVQEALLEDIVYPTSIVGKRLRYRLDGSRVLRVYLDPKERGDTEGRLSAFRCVYEKLTGGRTRVSFEYPSLLASSSSSSEA